MTPEQLKKYDFILLLDKSGSMTEKDCPGGQSRWEAAQESTIAFARKCMEYDDNGITVIPFAGSFKEYRDVTDGDAKVKQIFAENEPNGSTNTALALQHVLDGYFADKATKGDAAKPIIVVCITDGLPTDEPALVRCIVDAANKITADEEIGITFIQVGKDAHASAFLKRLDDNLTAEGAKFDIVDTKTMDELENMTLTEALMEALTD